VVGSLGEIKLSFKDGRSAALLEPEAATELQTVMMYEPRDPRRE
jgi:hypothetical protein